MSGDGISTIRFFSFLVGRGGLTTEGVWLGCRAKGNLGTRYFSQPVSFGGVLAGVLVGVLAGVLTGALARVLAGVLAGALPGALPGATSRLLPKTISGGITPSRKPKLVD